MCHWNTVNWNCIIRKETLEEKISEEEKHALSRLQKELSEQKKMELLFTDADLEKDITFFLSGHHVKPEDPDTGRSGMGEKGCRLRLRPAYHHWL